MVSGGEEVVRALARLVGLAQAALGVLEVGVCLDGRGLDTEPLEHPVERVLRVAHPLVKPVDRRAGSSGGVRRVVDRLRGGGALEVVGKVFREAGPKLRGPPVVVPHEEETLFGEDLGERQEVTLKPADYCVRHGHEIERLPLFRHVEPTPHEVEHVVVVLDRETLRTALAGEKNRPRQEVAEKIQGESSHEG